MKPPQVQFTKRVSNNSVLYFLSGSTAGDGFHSFSSSLYNDKLVACKVSLYPSESPCILWAFTCRFPVVFRSGLPLLLLTLLLCISMRSVCIVMLRRLQNTHFHLWLPLCPQSRDRLTEVSGVGVGQSCNTVLDSLVTSSVTTRTKKKMLYVIYAIFIIDIY